MLWIFTCIHRCDYSGEFVFSLGEDRRSSITVNLGTLNTTVATDSLVLGGAQDGKTLSTCASLPVSHSCKKKQPMFSCVSMQPNVFL